MKPFLLTIVLLSTFFSFGQNLVFHTSLNEPATINSQFYSATNFSKIDSLQLWSYQLDTYRGTTKDSNRPIGQITFWRTKPIRDTRVKSYPKFWTPTISFEIYSISEADYCFLYSKTIRKISSCTPPGTGGDVVIVGQFILLNRSVCVECYNPNTRTDYCRPIINYLFSTLQNKEAETIEKLVEPFGISRGQFISP